MIAAEEKRETLINALEMKIDESVRGPSFKSPKVKEIKVYVYTKDPLPSEGHEDVLIDEPVPKKKKRRKGKDKAPVSEPEYEMELFEDVNPDALSKRERKRFEKDLAKAKKKEEREKEKQRQREERAINKMRKDIKRRGFETGILYELEDPADIYDMTNDEITQIEMASVVNADGYYNFVYPFDYENVKKDHVGGKTVLIVGGFVIAIMILTLLLVQSLSRIT